MSSFNIVIPEIERPRKRMCIRSKEMTLEKGYIYSVTGNNGSGKSTFLKILSGLVKVDQLNFNTLGNVGYISSDFDLMDGFTRNQLIKLYQKGHKRFDKSLLMDFLYSFKLSGFDEFKELSKGEIKCILLCFTLACSPDTLILDEFYNGLDVSNKEIANKHFQNFIESENHTIFIATNHLEEVTQFADYFILVNKGVVSPPYSTIELQTSFRIDYMDSEAFNNCSADIISSRRIQDHYRVLTKSSNNSEKSDIEEVLLMLGGQDHV